MHELSIAVSLIEAAVEAAANEAGTVRTVHLRLGALSGVIAEALESAYQLARVGTPLERAELMIQPVPVVVRCRGCRTERELPMLDALWCPACGAAEEVVQGRELEIAALELET
ncbi:MAG: hydrogenase maturation nickel metallochaperone HypA [Gemmataceae bacterium]|nr:hydrogenase maturation nickel metallochaperone HypA [Gemmataceae bacterium]